MRNRTYVRALALIFATVSCLAAQLYVSGPQVLTFFSNVDDSDQPYGLYLPKNYNPAKAYPFVVSLHGSGSNHRLNLRRVFGKGNANGETDAQATRYFPDLPDVEFIVASPFARGSMRYEGIAEQDVLDMIADVQRRFKIDENRTYLTGLSMGGAGTLYHGLMRPDLWAAMAPVCPGQINLKDQLVNALNVPVHLFQGDADPTVPVARTRQLYKDFLSAGVHAEYVEYPGVKHNAWDPAYKDANIFRWFSQFKRNPSPDRVRYVARQYRHRSAYWVEFDGLTPGDPASIDARFDDVNRLQIQTRMLDGFTLKLAGHTKVQAGKPLRIAIDGKTIETEARAAISLVKTDGGWQVGRYEPKAGEKQAGGEGPILAGISARHVYVYGTADSPSPEVLRRRRQEASHAAEWFGTQPQVRLAISLFTAADTDVKLGPKQAPDLVLLGDKETNGIIRKYADRLPLELKKGAAPDIGVLFIAHVDGRYLLISSGLPWWTGIEQIEAPGGRNRLWASNHIFARFEFGDYAVFRGSIANIVARGWFDRQWKVPAAAAERLAALGVVTAPRQ